VCVFVSFLEAYCLVSPRARALRQVEAAATPRSVWQFLAVRDDDRLVGKTRLVLVIFQCQLEQIRIDLTGLRISAKRATKEKNVRLRTGSGQGRGGTVSE
jgi:hypothetical protein